MPDITTFWPPGAAGGDWAMAGADLATGLDIQTAVVISLFTDREAGADDLIPDGTQDPRGWCGDAGGETRIGSRLWLLDRAKATQQALSDARAYILEALQWLIDDGVASRVEATVSWIGAGALGAVVTVLKPDGAALVVRFDNAWNGTL